MAVFELNKPITSTTPFMDVENRLTAGVHTFQLVVVDDEGNASDPAKATVKVAGPAPAGPG